MSELGYNPGGPELFTKSPMRTGVFLNASVACLGTVVIVVYLVLAYHRVMTSNFIVVLCGFVGLWSYSQWSRCLRNLNRIRRLYTSIPEDQRAAGTQVDQALRVATVGMVDSFFFGSIVTACSLTLIWALLRHLTGAH